MEQDGSKPWLARPEWASAEIVARQGGKTGGLWLAALLWCGFCVPANLVLARELAAGNYPVLVVLLFDLVGVGLLAAAVRQTLSMRRYGNTPLQLDPYPGSIGGEVGGYFDARVPYRDGQVFTVTLTCLHTRVTGSGKNRSTHHDPLWQDTRQLLGEPQADGNTRLWFAFAPPAGLPPAQPPSDDYVSWSVSAHCKVPGVDFTRDWPLPVFATADRGSGLPRRRMAVAIAQEAAAVEAVTGFEQTTGGIAMDFRAGRHWGMALLLIVVFGGGFGGAGVFMGLQGDDPVVRWGMAPVFVLVGVVCLLAGLWQLGNRLRVESDGGGVRIRRWLFGVPVASHDIPRSSIAGIGFSQGAMMTVGGRVTRFYELRLQLADGGGREVGRDLAGTAQATQAAQAFASYTRLPFLGEVTVARHLPWQRSG